MKYFLVSTCILFVMSWSLGAEAYDEDHLKKLKLLGNCLSCDLTSADLFAAHLKGANLSKATLWGANLSNANLSGANLLNAFLREANLT